MKFLIPITNNDIVNNTLNWRVARRLAVTVGQQGFTIIELMIVVAVAGLIMIMVFLAVPALQRNQRNTARNNDAKRISAAVVSFISNHNLRLPSGSSNADSRFLYTKVGNMGQFKFATAYQTNTTSASSAWQNGKWVVASPASGNIAAPTTGSSGLIRSDSVLIASGYRCGARGAATRVGGRSTAVLYTLETSKDQVFTFNCIQVYK